MQEQIEQVFRQESGRIVAMLYTHIRNLELVEDCVQEAFIEAIKTWPNSGLPTNPAAWIAVVARRKAIDRIRRDQNLEQKKALLKTLLDLEQSQPDFDVGEIPDQRLKLLFTCCHPALSQQSQIALTLQTFGGLKTDEIARAFLVPVPTLAQRLVRAKRKIRAAGVPFQVPPLNKITDRLDVILSVLYLIFNAGYTAPAGPQLIRTDLCAEAIHLTEMLSDLLQREPGLAVDPEVLGLLALMLLHDSRSNSRIDAHGDLLTLEEQDRSTWHRDKIERGQTLLEQALAIGRIGQYQIQAAIAALHASAHAHEETDWPQIAFLYSMLTKMLPSPVVELNHAVATAMAYGIDQGHALLDRLEQSGNLSGYYLLSAARADFYRRQGKWLQAKQAYVKALELCLNEVEKRYLQRRIDQVTQAVSSANNHPPKGARL